MAARKPWFSFYSADWLKDPAVRAVSLAARGLWTDMLCLMDQSPRRGYLQHATGKPVTAEQLARMTGCSTDEVSRLLQELADAGVFSSTEHGVIYSRRMVRDERKRELCQAAGRRGGGNPSLTFIGQSKGAAKGHPKGRPKGSAKHAYDYVFEDPQGGSSEGTTGDPPKADSAQVPGKEEPPARNGKTNSDTDQQIEALYQLYPRRVGRGAALKAIRRALAQESYQVLEEAVRAYGKARHGQDPKFTPHPATWFNQERWRDDRSAWSDDAAGSGLFSGLREFAAERLPENGQQGGPT